MAWREADEWERERGWIRLVGNEGSCHLFLSTHCVTPGCYMPLSPPRVWRWRSTPPLLLFFFFFLSERVLHLQLCALPFPPRHSHHSPSLLSFALPSFLFFSSSSPLPPFKRMHYFQPRLCGVDREQNNGRLSVSRPSIGSGGGRTLAASIFFFSTVNSKQANAASLLLARLAAKLSRVKATLLQLFVCLHLCRPEKLWQEWEFLSQ